MRKTKDERRLLADLARGDRRAAEELAAQSYRQIYSSLIRLTGGREDLAADLTQETYRRAWASLRSFRGGSRFATWLYRIAYNTFLNHIRRPFPAEPLDEHRERSLSSPEPSQEESMQRKEVSLRLRRAVLGLPEELRFTVSARFWAELPVAEIADLEQVTGAAIRKRLKKAQGILRTTLEQEAS
jgi:RNA polymerase sigma-70 factor (ECF subfamily)